MKFTIAQKPFEFQKEVEVKLQIGKNDSLFLVVDSWNIFELLQDGTGRLCTCIPKDNEAGLQVDTEGKITLV